MADKSTSQITNHVTDYTNKPRFLVSDDPTGTPVDGYMDTDNIAGIGAAAAAAALAAIAPIGNVSSSGAVTAGHLAVWVDADTIEDGGAPGAASGDFSGPGSSVTGNAVSFADTTGKVGQDSGLLISGDAIGNIGVGTQIFVHGEYPNNIAIGQGVLASLTTGNGNIGIGADVLELVTSGEGNTVIGVYSGLEMETASKNTVIGASALAECDSDDNVAIGFSALAVGKGARNIAIGAYAACHGNDDDTLIIDNQDRSDAATEKLEAIIYGVMASAPADQELHINAVMSTLGRKRAVTIKTASYSATAIDDVIVCNKATSMTITLPAATGSGQSYTIKSINTGVITVEVSGGGTIDNGLTATLNQWDSIDVVDIDAGMWVLV